MKMISQEQSERIPPVETKRSLMTEEEWKRTNLLLVILGIEIPLLGGFWVWNNDPWYYVMIFSVAIGAFLLRSWWAILVVPVVFAIGVTLGILFLPFLQSGWPAVQAILGSGMMEGMDFLLFLGTPAVIVLASIGAAIGVLLGKWIKRMREG
jgi:hypothetical protein